MTSGFTNPHDRLASVDPSGRRYGVPGCAPGGGASRESRSLSPRSSRVETAWAPTLWRSASRAVPRACLSSNAHRAGIRQRATIRRNDVATEMAEVRLDTPEDDAASDRQTLILVLELRVFDQARERHDHVPW